MLRAFRQHTDNHDSGAAGATFGDPVTVVWRAADAYIVEVKPS